MIAGGAGSLSGRGLGEAPAVGSLSGRGLGEASAKASPSAMGPLSEEVLGARRQVYRMAPHSPYDATHLVPRAASPFGWAVLDPRGCFLVQVRPFACFCETLHLRLFLWVHSCSDGPYHESHVGIQRA